MVNEKQNNLSDESELFSVEIIFKYKELKHIFKDMAKKDLMDIVLDNIDVVQMIVQEKCTDAIEDYLITIANDKGF